MSSLCYESTWKWNIHLVKYCRWHTKDESIKVHVDHWRRGTQIWSLWKNIKWFMWSSVYNCNVRWTACSKPTPTEPSCSVSILPPKLVSKPFSSPLIPQLLPSHWPIVAASYVVHLKSTHPVPRMIILKTHQIMSSPTWEPMTTLISKLNPNLNMMYRALSELSPDCLVLNPNTPFRPL